MAGIREEEGRRPTEPILTGVLVGIVEAGEQPNPALAVPHREGGFQVLSVRRFRRCVRRRQRGFLLAVFLRVRLPQQAVLPRPLVLAVPRRGLPLPRFILSGGFASSGISASTSMDAGDGDEAAARVRSVGTAASEKGTVEGGPGGSRTERRVGGPNKRAATQVVSQPIKEADLVIKKCSGI